MRSDPHRFVIFSQISHLDTVKYTRKYADIYSSLISIILSKNNRLYRYLLYWIWCAGNVTMISHDVITAKCFRSTKTRGFLLSVTKFLRFTPGDTAKFSWGTSDLEICQISAIKRKIQRLTLLNNPQVCNTKQTDVTRSLDVRWSTRL